MTKPAVPDPFRKSWVRGRLNANPADPLSVRIISDEPISAPYERSAEEVTIVERIRRVAREM